MRSANGRWRHRCDIAAGKTEFCHRWVVELFHPFITHLRKFAGWQAGDSTRYQAALHLIRDNDVFGRRQHEIDAVLSRPGHVAQRGPTKRPKKHLNDGSATCPPLPLP